MIPSDYIWKRKAPGRLTLAAFHLPGWYDLGNCLWWFDESCCVHAHRYTMLIAAYNRNGRPVGMLTYKYEADGSVDFSRAVHPRARGRGVATALLQALIAWNSDHVLTCTSIHPWMWPKLERLGFVPNYSRGSIGAGRDFRRPVTESPSCEPY